MNRRRLLGGVLLGLGLTTGALRAGPSVGGDFSLVGGLSGGVGAAAGGDFAVAATIGKPPAEPVTGGDFAVTGELVGLTTVIVEGDVALTVGFILEGLIRIEWPAEATGYVLEFTPQIGEPTNWQPVTPPPVGNTHVAPFDQPFRLFRLRKP